MTASTPKELIGKAYDNGYEDGQRDLYETLIEEAKKGVNSFPNGDIGSAIARWIEYQRELVDS